MIRFAPQERSFVVPGLARLLLPAMIVLTSGVARSAASIDEFLTHGRERPLDGRRRPRRQRLVHRVSRSAIVGRITPGGTITEFVPPHAIQCALWDHHGPGRQPLVHRIWRQQSRAAHA